MGFTGSRVTLFVEEPLSETRVPGVGSAPAHPAALHQHSRAGKGQGFCLLQLSGLKCRRKGRHACCLQASCGFLSNTKVGEEGVE